METVTTRTTPRLRGRLARKVLLLLLPLTLLPLLIVGAASFSRSYSLFRSQIDTQLTEIVNIQGERVENRVARKDTVLASLVSDPTFTIELDTALDIGHEGPLFASVRDRLLLAYENTNERGQEPAFNHLLVVLPDSTILVSTIPGWEGKKLADTPAYKELLGGKKTTALFDVAPLDENKLLTFTSHPYIVESQRVATLIGVSEPLEVQRILENSAAFNNQAHAYLYTKDQYLLGLDSTQESLIALVPSDSKKQAITSHHSQGTSNTFSMPSFDGGQSLAIVKWIPSLEADLIVELPQSIVYAQVIAMLPFAIIVMVLSLAIAGAAVWQGTRWLVVNPLDRLTETTRLFAEGDWRQRAEVDRDDEIGILATSFNQMADELTNLYRSLEALVEERSQQVRAAAEVAQIASSAPNLDALLNRTVELIIERFNFYDASIFLIDETRETAVLRASGGKGREAGLLDDFKVGVGSRSMIGWVTSNNKPRLAQDVTQDPFFLSEEALSETRAEAAVPISFGEYVIGALDVQSNQTKGLDQDDVNIMQTLANQVATAIHNIRLLESTTVNLEEASLLYQASRRIAQAETNEGILRVVADAMSESSYMSAILVAEDNGLHIFANSNPYPLMRAIDASPPPTWLPVAPSELNLLLPGGSPLLIDDLSDSNELPEGLKPVLSDWQSVSAALLPMMRTGQTPIFLLMGSPKKSLLSYTTIQPFASLAELSATALEKVQALQDMQKSLAELQALSTTSQIVAGGSNLNDLYKSLHNQVTEVMGDVRFLISLYNPDTNQIEVPYMYDKTSIKTLPPFPLGTGLSSILIRTKQPLMIVENTEQRTRELGAIIVGQTAKSWLGVPLVVGGEAIGAIIVQDTEVEHRFNENDKRILGTLAGQVAATIYNVRLLERTRQQAERERRLHEVVNKIRASADMKSILTTTANELGKVLGLRRARIEVGVQPQPAAEEVVDVPVKEAVVSGNGSNGNGSHTPGIEDNAEGIEDNAEGIEDNAEGIEDNAGDSPSQAEVNEVSDSENETQPEPAGSPAETGTVETETPREDSSQPDGQDNGGGE